jgi:hypothetical protein
MNHMLRARWSAAAVTALAACACAAGGVTQGTGTAPGWLAYTQPPGPMLLTFAYPPTWKASGATFVSTMGNVGRAQVTGDTAATIAAFDAASCLKRVRLLHGSGAFVSWSANIGSPIPIRLSEMPGRKVWVNCHPAKLGETKSSDCGPETLINGAIEMGPRSFLFMHAEVGARAKPATLAAVRKIFFSGRASRAAV